MIPKGFEPLTRRLEICCSIQLSYGTSINFKVQNPIFRRNSDFELFVGVAGFEPTTFCSQSRRDTGLRYTPKIFANIRTSERRFKIFRRFNRVDCFQSVFFLFACGEGGIRTPGKGYPLRQFSKLLVSATHPPLQVVSQFWDGKCSP